jgi:hypothetical protein
MTLKVSLVKLITTAVCIHIKIKEMQWYNVDARKE